MKHQLVAITYSGIWTVLDWIFPPECAACGELGCRLCVNCQDKINFITDRHQNQANGKRASSVPTGGRDLIVPDFCTDSRHLAHYEGVIRECIHALKYDENRGIGELFSRWLSPLVREAGWLIDLVVPVPLSEQRLHERGYNQAALIARPLAARLQTQYNEYGLKRVLNTPSQVGLSADERRSNVAGAFKAEPGIAGSKAILLVDDVMTTGSTLGACARAVLDAGAISVFAVTVARHIDSVRELL